MEHLWLWFCELAATRGLVLGMGGAVYLPITHTEIAAWACLTGRDPAPWEVAVLRRLDNAVLAILRQNAGKGDDHAEIDAGDAEGMHALFSTFLARARTVHSKKA